MSQRGRGRRKKAIVVTVAALAVAAAAVVILLPALLATGPGRALAARAVEGAIDGRVAFDALDVGWRGPQQVRGATVTTHDGEPVARLDVTLDGGLLPLLLGRLDRVNAPASGAIDVAIDADGRTGIGRVLGVGSRDDDEHDARADEGLPPFDLRLDGVEVHAHGDGLDETFLVEGHVERDARGTLDIAIAGTGDGDRVFRVDAALRPGVPHPTGRVTGVGVPTSLLQPWLDLGLEAGLVGVRDLGPTIDVSIKWPSGTEGAIVVSAHAERLHVMIEGMRDGDVLRGDHGVVRGTVPPALRARLGLPASAPPTACDVTLSSFSMPAAGTWSERLAATNVAASVRVTDPVAVRPDGMLEFADVVADARVADGMLELTVASVVGSTALVRPATIELVLDPLTLGETLPDRVAFTVTARELHVAADGAPERAIVVRAIDARGHIDRAGRPVLHATATADVLAAGSGDGDGDGEGAMLARATLEDLAISLDGPLDGGPHDGRRLDGTLHLTGLAPASLERALALAPETLTAWLGSDGRATITLAPPEAGADDAGAESAGPDRPLRLTIDTAFPRLTTTFTCTIARDTVTIAAPPFTAAVPPAATAAILGGDAIAGALPLTVTVHRCVLPRATSDRPADWSRARLDVEATGGPLVVDRDGHRTTVRDLRLAAATTDARAGITWRFDGRAERDDGNGPVAAAGPIALTGRVSNLVRPGGAIDPSTATFSIEGEASGIPTAIVEHVVGLGSVLTAAFGPTVDATVETDGFSTAVAHDTGHLTARLTAPTGWIDARLEGRGGLVVVPSDRPLRAEVTPARRFGEEILGSIHPALAALCPSTGTIAIEIADARFPTDGDLRALDADVRIEIGDATFDAKAAIFGPFEAAGDLVADAIDGDADANANADAAGGDRWCTPTVEGAVDPIVARIRAGVITYDSFVIRVGKQRLEYTGSVDLVARTLDIQTEVPVAALGAIGQKIPVLPTGITVPVRTTGPFDDLRTQVELDRLVGNVPEALLGPLLDIFKKD